MADKFKISSLNAALDEYLAKIDKVNLSRGVLESNRDLLLQTVRQLEQIDAKMDAVRRSGLSDGERSGMLSLLGNVRSGMLSGKDLSGYLRQESRQMDLARQGSAMSQLSRFTGMDRIAMQEVSRGLQSSGLAGLLPSSTQMLGSLLSWSGSRSGVPSAGMMSHLQSRAFSLGSSLTSGDSLLEDVEEDARDDKFSEAVESIKQTSDEIVDALQGNGGDVQGIARSRQESAIKGSTSSRRLSGDWVDSLTTIGAVVGTVAALGGLFLIPKVQDFLAMLADPERRREWWNGMMDKFSSLWNGIKDTTTKVLDKVEDVVDVVGDVYRTMNTEGSVSDAVVSGIDRGFDIYKSSTVSEQDNFKRFAGELRSHGAIQVDGMDAVASIGDQMRGAVGDMAQSVSIGGVALSISPKFFKTFKKIYRVATGAISLSAVSTAALSVCGLLGVATYGLVLWEWYKANKAARQIFNAMSISAAMEEGSSIVVVFEDGADQPSIVPLALIAGSDGTSAFDTMGAMEQYATAASVATDLDSHIAETNDRMLLDRAISSGKLSPELHKEAERLLKDGSSADIASFREAHHAELLEASKDKLSPTVLSDRELIGMPAIDVDSDRNDGVMIFTDPQEMERVLTADGQMDFTPFEGNGYRVSNGSFSGGSALGSNVGQSVGDRIDPYFERGRSDAERELRHSELASGAEVFLQRVQEAARAGATEGMSSMQGGGSSIVSQSKTNVIMASNTQGDEQ